MKQIRKCEIILDVDDVLLDCNAYALRLLSEKEGKEFSLDHVTGWGLLGIDEDRRLDFLKDRSFYVNQPPLPGAQDFLRRLCEIADVTIMTAVYPQFMGERIQRIGEVFPFFPMENIIMGQRKEMVHADIMLDDGVHNLLSSGAALPVLFRQPWNRNVSGICSINTYNEFLSLVRILLGDRMELSSYPHLICIVGPSGSGKHALADALCERSDFERIRTCTTSPHYGKNHHLENEEFTEWEKAGRFIESTYYGGERYGLPETDIRQALENNRHAVAVMDISGCMALELKYPGQTMILYAQRDKKDCIRAILEKDGMNPAEQTDRILSIDLEEKNRILADHIIQIDPKADCREAAEQIFRILSDSGAKSP